MDPDLIPGWTKVAKVKMSRRSLCKSDWNYMKNPSKSTLASPTLAEVLGSTERASFNGEDNF
jgi:hypothetical protein